MTRHQYEASKEICTLRHENNWPYYALIMAAMRDGDTMNRAKLKAAFPDIWQDLWERYDAPGGVLDGDPLYYGPGKNFFDHKRSQEVKDDGITQ